LWEHKEDIPAIAESLLRDMNTKHERTVAGLADSVLDAFLRYSWPGNVRELRNTLERAVIVCDADVIEPRHLPPNFGTTIPISKGPSDPSKISIGVGTTVGEAEKQLILKTLESTSNNKTRAAEILGISLKTLHNKLKEYSAANHAQDIAAGA
jgi:DNA-binding NtrC family response regulator